MKPSPKQRQKFLEMLKSYRTSYLGKKNMELDESATRIMVNHFLGNVLGYEELEEIRTEYAIRGTYADYVIQSARKKHFIVEVKAISLNLSENHLRQALGYGANEGIDWVLLTNGKQFQLYRIIFGKPVKYRLVFSFDLTDITQLKQSVDFFIYLTKKYVEKGELEKFWNRFQALEPVELAKRFYYEDIIRLFRRTLKKKTGLNFSEQDVLNSIHQIVTKKIEMPNPEIKKMRRK